MISGKPYQPKNDMCIQCCEFELDCSKLSFEKMPIIKEDEDRCIVKCTAFIPVTA